MNQHFIVIILVIITNSGHHRELNCNELVVIFSFSSSCFCTSHSVVHCYLLDHHHAWIVASSGSTFHRNYLWLSLRIMIIMIFLIIILNTCRRVYDARTSQSVGQRLSQTNLLSMFGNTRVRRIYKQPNKKGNKQTKWGSNPNFSGKSGIRAHEGSGGQGARSLVLLIIFNINQGHVAPWRTTLDCAITPIPIKYKILQH